MDSTSPISVRSAPSYTPNLLSRLLRIREFALIVMIVIIAIALQLIAKLVLLHALIEDEAFVVIALIPFAARIGPLLWSRWLPDLHAGLGARFRGVIRPVDLAIWALLLAVASWRSPPLLIAPLLLGVWGWWLHRKIGGISGDGHGAGIEVTESALLLAALIWLKLA